MNREQMMWCFALSWALGNTLGYIIARFEGISVSNLIFLIVGFFWLFPNKSKWPLN